MDLITFVNESVVLSRELEVSKDKILNLIMRAEKISNERGTILNYSEAVYNSAWTIFWWYGDEQLYIEKYLEYERIAVQQVDVEYIKNLATLWINLYVISRKNEITINIDEHIKIVIDQHNKYIMDTSKPNASLEARASYQMVRLTLQEDIDEITDEYIEILRNCECKLYLKVSTIEKIVTGIPMLKEAKRYSVLFEELLTVVGKRTNEIKVAKMLLSRAQDIMDTPYDALVFNSRALTLLLKEESKSELLHGLINIGVNMGEVGCIWAARNFFMYASCLALNQFFKFNDYHPALEFSIINLKKIEVEMGRILYASEFHHLHLIIRGLKHNKSSGTVLFDTKVNI